MRLPRYQRSAVADVVQQMETLNPLFVSLVMLHLRDDQGERILDYFP